MKACMNCRHWKSTPATALLMCVCELRSAIVPGMIVHKGPADECSSWEGKEDPRLMKTYPEPQIQDEAEREQAYAALAHLWDTLDLSHQKPRLLMSEQERTRRAAHEAAYRFLAELLLGRESPEKETLC